MFREFLELVWQKLKIMKSTPMTKVVDSLKNTIEVLATICSFRTNWGEKIAAPKSNPVLLVPFSAFGK